MIGAKRQTRTTPIYQELKLMKFHEIYVYCVQLLMYKFYHFKLPTVIDEMFTLKLNIHRAETTSRIVGVDPQWQRSRLQNFDSHDRRLSIITHQSRLSKKYIKIFFIWV